MFRNLLRRFGYIKLNDEDKRVLALHYCKHLEDCVVISKVEHIENLGLDTLSCFMLAHPGSKLRASFTCDQPDEK